MVIFVAFLSEFLLVCYVTVHQLWKLLTDDETTGQTGGDFPRLLTKCNGSPLPIRQFSAEWRCA